MLYDAFKKELLQLLAMVESEKARKGIAVAFSGGSDSVALLHLLLRFGKEQQLPIYAVHVEHGIRGQTSLDDADFAKSFCRKLAVPLEVVHIDVPGYVAKNSGVSVEEAARTLRYAALKQKAGDFGVSAICFGHHMDDQVETVLLNILRGTGVAGLRGIPRFRRDGGVCYLRPLLGFSKQKILAYCKDWNLEFAQDETNLEMDYTRNRVRLELIPYLETYNPSVKAALHRLSQAAGEIEDFLDEKVSEISSRIIRGEKYIGLDLTDYDKMPLVLQKKVLRSLVKELTGNFPDHAQTALLEEIAQKREGSSYHQLTGQLVASREYDLLYLATCFESLPEPKFLFSEDENGLYSYKDWHLEVVARDGKPVLGSMPFCETVDGDKLSLPLDVRCRKPGDVFHPLGAKGAKKLKDFFIDLKIPKRVRNRVPLVVDAKGNIIWVVGFRISDLVKVDENTEKYITLRIVSSCHLDSPVL